MPNTIHLEELQRLQKPWEDFVAEAERLMKNPARKTCRADRTLRVLKGKQSISLSPENVSFSLLYDTKENRWICYLIRSILKHFDDLKSHYSIDESAEELWGHLFSKLATLSTHPHWQRVFENAMKIKEIVQSSVYDRALYNSYVILKDALAEMEAEIEIRLSEVNWLERDVLVGSFGSEEQFRHNLAKKYYYAPERHFDPTCFPIRYVALYQSARFSESGICYYGAVTAIRRVKRKKIRFGVRRQNGEEDYYLFRVKEWKRLSSPIEIQDEGVFAPKYTNMFLLMNAQKTYELFHITSERDYRIYRQLQRILSHASDPMDPTAQYPIECGKSIRVQDENLELLDEKGRLMRVASVLNFSLHPTQYLDDFFACIAREPTPSDLPLWMIRENEAYEAKYGEPYREDD
ncbi:MAG: hypothetical protein J6Q82_04655 [Clostridia bacterium]|nr:hypothetical protein [Clostridia bacterium]